MEEKQIESRLTVLEENYERRIINGVKILYSKCLCSCGTICIVNKHKVHKSKRSCGCLQKEVFSQLCKPKLRSKNIRLSNIHYSMKTRCYNPKSTIYSYYGGREIKICEEWLNYENFYNWAITNGYTEKSSIDRIDVNGDYTPVNCRWVTQEFQNQNTRATLGWEKVNEIRSLFKLGKKVKELAILYNVHRCTIQGIIYNKTYKIKTA